MIKIGDLIGWSAYKSNPTSLELDDFGIVVSNSRDKVRIAWAIEPDEPIDEYPLSWVTAVIESGELVVLSRPG